MCYVFNQVIIISISNFTVSVCKLPILNFFLFCNYMEIAREEKKCNLSYLIILNRNTPEGFSLNILGGTKYD